MSRKIDDTIVTVANQLMADDPSLSTKVTCDEWRVMVRAAFGPVLAMIDLDVDPAKNVDTVLTEIKTELSKHVSGYGVREFTFGCTLFGNPEITPFAIGPVCFEPRIDWLTRKSSEGAISATTRRRVEQAWSGKPTRKRKPSADSICETDILESIGSCPFVCSITTSGLAAEAGREKALTAARLAIAAIALLWATPSRALEGMNLLFDRRIHHQKTLTFVPGKIVLAGSRLSHMPHGPWLKEGQWETEFAKYTDHFLVVGQILNYVIDATGNAARPKMMNALAQALLWFHEGSREIVALMAIVKYSAALDALACGGKSGGIRRLVNARLGIQDSHLIRPNGPTLKQAVVEIYSDGRSRTIHGTNEKLGYDWSGTRSLSEQFSRLCLLACIEWAAQNSSSDDPKLLSRM
ncbi:MAG: hypothetical protein HQL35_15645 [Alphaproteobacteria bacterium]|nr:hypothetical protein [Alphaproteobacteria bacterium]